MTRTDGLRTIVEAVDREVSRLVAQPEVAGKDTTPLLMAWAELVEFLALGPPLDLRACPRCGSVGMRGATRCGICWGKLDPSTASIPFTLGKHDSQDADRLERAHPLPQ